MNDRAPPGQIMVGPVFLAGRVLCAETDCGPKCVGYLTITPMHTTSPASDHLTGTGPKRLGYPCKISPIRTNLPSPDLLRRSDDHAVCRSRRSEQHPPV